MMRRFGVRHTIFLYLLHTQLIYLEDFSSILFTVPYQKILNALITGSRMNIQKKNWLGLFFSSSLLLFAVFVYLYSCLTSHDKCLRYFGPIFQRPIDCLSSRSNFFPLLCHLFLSCFFLIMVLHFNQDLK